jgi:MFS family permease
MLLYFTYWFPRRHHARIVSGFLVGLPIAVALGAPISTGLLGLDGLFGLKGWQIMYIAEAVPTIVIGCLTLLVLTDRPAQATFLTAEEKGWLAAKLASERPPTQEAQYGVRADLDVRRNHGGQSRVAVLHAGNHCVAPHVRWRDPARCDGAHSVCLRHHRTTGLGSHR